MREKPTGEVSPKGSKARNKFRSRTDAQVRRGLERDSEVHPTDESFWKPARIVRPVAKHSLTVAIDEDVLEWLRKQKGYEARVNAVLRNYMERHSYES